MGELLQILGVFLLVLVVAAAPLAGILAVIVWPCFGAGRRRAGFAGLAAFLLAATVAAYAVTVSPDPAGLIDLQAVAFLPAGPLYYGIKLLDAGLWVALGLMTFALAAAVLALRRWPGGTGVILAAAIGASAVPVAVQAQYLWSRGQMERGAAGMDCVDIRPLWAANGVLTDVAAGFAGDFHAIGRKGTELWVWSYRAGGWIPLKPRDGKSQEDYRPWLSC